MEENCKITKEEHIRLVDYVSYNANGRRLAFDFINENWEKLIKKYESDPQMIYYLVSNVFGKFNSNLELKYLRAFGVQHQDLSVAKNAYEQALEKVEINISWMEQYYKSLSSEFSNDK